jgi:N-acyl-D-amino-acid deacylase
VAAVAEREGRDVREVGYDMMLEDDCTAFMFVPHMGYVHGDLEATRGMLEYKGSILSGSDAGAHVETVCDGASSTFMLTHWARDRTRGPKLPLEYAVHKQTQDTATALGMYDRGVLDAGYLADINIIDFENLKLRLPEMVYDLPTGAGRLDQRADGYVATIKRGVVIIENDEDTGARPGQVVRSRPRDEAMAAE